MSNTKTNILVTLTREEDGLLYCETITDLSSFEFLNFALTGIEEIDVDTAINKFCVEEDEGRFSDEKEQRKEKCQEFKDLIQSHLKGDEEESLLFNTWGVEYDNNLSCWICNK